MDTAGALEVIESERSRVPADALLGAGTITDVAAAEAAIAAGAAFLVTPNLDLNKEPEKNEEPENRQEYVTNERGYFQLHCCRSRRRRLCGCKPIK
jgi:hypothetical protein